MASQEFMQNILGQDNRRSLFKHFGRFYSSLTLTTRKIRQRHHHNTFSPDEGLSVLTGLFGGKDLATHILQIYIAGGLVHPLQEETGLALGITRKGECIASGELDGQVLWVDWIPGGGDNPGVKDLAKHFARFVGGYPNEWSPEKEKQRDARSGNAVTTALDPEYVVTDGNNSGSQISDGESNASFAGAASRLLPDSVSNFVVPPGIMVKERTLLLKAYTHTFAGTEGVQHLLKHTSCMTPRECISILSQFMSRGWIACVEDPEKSAPNALPTYKDSAKAVYQLTTIGAQFAGWPESSAPITKELNFFSKEGIKGRLRKIAGLSPSGLSSGPSSSAGDMFDDMISKENLDRFEEFVKKSSDVLNSPDGATDSVDDVDPALIRTPRRGTASTITNAPSSGTPLASSGTSSASEAPSKGRRPRSATIGSETPSSSRSRVPSANPTPLLPRPGSATGNNANFWEMAKETNATRLTTILMIPSLRTAFQKYLATLFCQENYDFMVDVERFRLCYDSPLRAAQSTEMLDPSSKPIVSAVQRRSSLPQKQGLLFPHAVAIYLKYVAKGSPFELNLPSKLQAHLRTTMAKAEPFFAKFTSTLDLSTTSPVDPTSASFRQLVDNLGDDFWNLRDDNDNGGEEVADDSVGPWMFSTAEAHIFQMVAGDSVPKFAKTEGYKTLMKKLWEEGTLTKVQNTVMAATGGGGTPTGTPGTTPAVPGSKSYITDSGAGAGEATKATQYVPRASTDKVAVVEPPPASGARPRPNSFIPGI